MVGIICRPLFVIFLLEGPRIMIREQNMLFNLYYIIDGAISPEQHLQCQ